MPKQPLYPHVSKTQSAGAQKKYEVTIQFAWASENTREMVWAEVQQYIRQNMRDLATVIKVSNELPPLTASQTIALNEP